MRTDFPPARTAAYFGNATSLSVHSAAALHRYVEWLTHEVGEPWWPVWAETRDTSKAPSPPDGAGWLKAWEIDTPAAARRSRWGVRMTALPRCPRQSARNPAGPALASGAPGGPAPPQTALGRPSAA